MPLDPNSSSTLTPPSMNTLSLEELEKLQTSLENRHRFIGRWAAPVTGFFDGFYDKLALSNIAWLITASIIAIAFPPAGVPLLFVSIAAIGGMAAATGGIVHAKESYKREVENYETTKKRLETAIKIAKALKALNILQATTHNTVDNALPTPDNPIDQVDFWSRMARNSIGLVTIMSSLIYGALGAAMNPFTLAVIAGGSILQLVPKIFQRRLETERTEAVKKLNQFIHTQRLRLPAAHEALKDTENLEPLRSASPVSLNSTESFTNHITQKISDFTNSAKAVSNKIIEKITSLTPVKKLIANFSSKKIPETTATTSLYQQLEEQRLSASEIQKGQRLATLLGVAHGALHPLAWLAITGFVVSLFIPGLNIGTLAIGGIIAVAVTASALSITIGTLLGRRAKQKEMEIAKRVEDQFSKARNTTLEVENTLSNTESLTKIHINNLKKIYKENRTLLLSKSNPKAKETKKILQSLKTLLNNQCSNHDANPEKENINELDKTCKDLIQQFSDTTNINKLVLGNEQPLIARRLRDFFALFETPVTATLAVVFFGIPLMLPIMAVAAIPMTASLIKDKIDQKRVKGARMSEIISDKLELGLNLFKSKKHAIRAAHIQKENDFSKEARTLVNKFLFSSTEKPITHALMQQYSYLDLATTQLPAASTPTTIPAARPHLRSTSFGL